MIFLLLLLLVFLPLLLLWRPWSSRYAWRGRFRGRYGPEYRDY